jgi:hypothetical protein
MDKQMALNLFTRLLVVLSLVGFTSMTCASDLAKTKATGPVLLKINGKISIKNAADAAEFDDAILDALPQKSIVTETPWTKGMVKFTGPLLADVLAAVNATGTNLKAYALNDYKVNIPVEDAKKFGVILARQMDGKPLAVRDKGPLFVMYPFAQIPEIKTSVYFSRCIWQLQSITVE